MNTIQFTLNDLNEIIEKRKIEYEAGFMESTSYTGMLFRKGRNHIQRKIVEEALEVILDSHDDDREALVKEIGDLIYHVMVLAQSHNISIKDIENCLALKHQSCSVAEETKKDFEILLREYQITDSILVGEKMLKHVGIDSTDDVEVFFFSHNFRKRNLAGVRNTNLFSVHGKILRNRFQEKGVKVKLGIAPGERENFIKRRDSDVFIPIILIVNSVLLPLTINLLAAYIKDLLNDKDNNSKNSEIEIQVGIIKSKERNEVWYKIKGLPKEVYKILTNIETKLK